MIRQYSDDVEVFISLKPSSSAPLKNKCSGVASPSPGPAPSSTSRIFPVGVSALHILEELFWAQWFAPTAAKIESKDGAIEIDDHPRTWPVACWAASSPARLIKPLDWPPGG